jgi:hypothetical protein
MLEKLGRRNENLESLLPLGRPLRSRQSEAGIGQEEEAEWRRLFAQWEGEEGLPALSSSSDGDGGSGDESSSHGSRYGEGSAKAHKEVSPRKRAKRMVEKHARAKDSRGRSAGSRHKSSSRQHANESRRKPATSPTSEVSLSPPEPKYAEAGGFAFGDVQATGGERTYRTGRVFTDSGWQVDEKAGVSRDPRSRHDDGAGSGGDHRGHDDSRNNSHGHNAGHQHANAADSSSHGADTNRRTGASHGSNTNNPETVTNSHAAQSNQGNTKDTKSPSETNSVSQSKRPPQIPPLQNLGALVNQESNTSNSNACGSNRSSSTPQERAGSSSGGSSRQSHGGNNTSQNQSAYAGSETGLRLSTNLDNKSNNGSIDAALMHDKLATSTNNISTESAGGWSVNTVGNEQNMPRNAIVRAEVGKHPTMSTTPRAPSSSGSSQGDMDDVSWLQTMKAEFVATKSKSKQLRSLM